MIAAPSFFAPLHTEERGHSGFLRNEYKGGLFISVSGLPGRPKIQRLQHAYLRTQDAQRDHVRLLETLYGRRFLAGEPQRYHRQ